MESFLEKQVQLLEEGKIYEFAQNIVNRAKRHLAKKEYTECQNLAMNGILHLLKKKTNESVPELQDLLVQAAVTPLNFPLIEEIISLLPEDAGIVLMKKIAKNCSDPNIYELLAKSMENQENIPKAFLYWIGANNFKNLLRTLQILIDRGYPGEQDLFICRTTLMLLTFKNSGVATHLLSEFKYLESPLLNFSKFLIQAVESNERTLVNILREKYSKWLARDPKLTRYLIQVEKVYFSGEQTNSLLSLLG